MTIDQIVVSLSLKIEQSNYYAMPLEVTVSEDFLI